MHCQVAHDDVLEDLVTLHPDAHLGGSVRVEEGAELGTGSIVIPGLTIGTRAVLGAGCTVVRSLPGDATYVGVPATPVVRRDRGFSGARPHDDDCFVRTRSLNGGAGAARR